MAEIAKIGGETVTIGFDGATKEQGQYYESLVLTCFKNESGGSTCGLSLLLVNLLNT